MNNIIGIFGVVFVTFKLTGVVDWSWWWVLLPFYGWVIARLIVAFIAIMIVASR